ncbi:hypothetical protein ACI3QN_13595, partial [Propionibacterium freudenreichii]|uniref:hypothetical protein n=1 Tax=Propionibacterium freudenreichii TaxID=1744 RepID=UPI003853F114
GISSLCPFLITGSGCLYLDSYSSGINQNILKLPFEVRKGNTPSGGGSIVDPDITLEITGSNFALIHTLNYALNNKKQSS